MEKVSEEYEKFLNWCEDKWTLDYKWKKLLSKLSNDDIDFLKDQYETRLRADMVAMLEDIQLEIDEIPIVTRHGITGTVMTAQGMRKKIKENIQQKIDKLKGKTGMKLLVEIPEDQWQKGL